MSDKLIGSLQYWSEAKGFGFIHHVDTEGALASYYVHPKNCINLTPMLTPVLGSEVRFRPDPENAVPGKTVPARDIEFTELRPRYANKPSTPTVESSEVK